MKNSYFSPSSLSNLLKGYGYFTPESTNIRIRLELAYSRMSLNELMKTYLKEHDRDQLQSLEDYLKKKFLNNNEPFDLILFYQVLEKFDFFTLSYINNRGSNNPIISQSVDNVYNKIICMAMEKRGDDNSDKYKGR